MTAMNRALITALSNIIAGGAAMDPAATWIGLIIDSSAPITRDTDLTDGTITEANFTGYARIPVGAWTAPYESSAGTVRVESNRADFVPGDALAPNTIIGAMLCNADGSVAAVDGELLAIELFDSPVSLLGPLDICSITAFLDELLGGGFGVAS